MSKRIDNVVNEKKARLDAAIIEWLKTHLNA